MDTPMQNTFKLSELMAESGATLQLYTAISNAPAKAVVHINHGLAEHAARYDGFAKALNDAGFHVYAQDHRGHGKTETRQTNLGDFDSKDAKTIVLDDVGGVQKHIQSAHPDLPIILFGHSMGGLIAMNYALKSPDHLAGIAVWNANFSGGLLGKLGQLLLKWEKMRRGSDTPSQILPKLTFTAWGKAIKNNRTNFDWLSHKPEEVDAYIADPLCGWDASVGMWQTIFDWVFNGSDPEALKTLPKDLPFMLLGGGEDPATEKAKATKDQAERLKSAGLQSVECHIFENARHETLNDLDAEEATQSFINWANRCIEAK